jgi:hypothetical protein
MIEDVCQRHVIGSDPFKIENCGATSMAAATRCAPMFRYWEF